MIPYTGYTCPDYFRRGSRLRYMYAGSAFCRRLSTENTSACAGPAGNWLRAALSRGSASKYRPCVCRHPVSAELGPPAPASSVTTRRHWYVERRLRPANRARSIGGRRPFPGRRPGFPCPRSFHVHPVRGRSMHVPFVYTSGPFRDRP